MSVRNQSFPDDPLLMQRPEVCQVIEVSGVNEPLKCFSSLPSVSPTIETLSKKSLELKSTAVPHRHVSEYVTPPPALKLPL